MDNKNKYVDRTNGTKPFLEFHLKKNYKLPLVFNTKMYNDIDDKNARNIILHPDVVKAIIGRVIIDYKPEFSKESLSEIYKILGYIQFGKKKEITKYGAINDYVIIDINRDVIILFLYSEEIIEDYFPSIKKNNYQLKLIPYIENGIEKLSINKENYNNDVLININYLNELYGKTTNNLAEGFSLSQKVCSMIPDP